MFALWLQEVLDRWGSCRGAVLDFETRFGTNPYREGPDAVSRRRKDRQYNPTVQIGAEQGMGALQPRL